MTIEAQAARATAANVFIVGDVLCINKGIYKWMMQILKLFSCDLLYL